MVRTMGVLAARRAGGGLYGAADVGGGAASAVPVPLGGSESPDGAGLVCWGTGAAG